MLLLALFPLAAGAWAQGPAAGTVSDEGGTPLAGVSVVIKGTTTGTVTDADGRYSLAARAGQTLVYSFIGFRNQERLFGGAPIDVAMAEEATGLDEVVVTALGIEREKKALGYAVQEVNAENLAANRTTSVANMLQGQVAGVQITQSTNGIGGSTRIVMRGLNSLGGNNQPLWVVDGVPINDDRRDDAN